jgi:hypothetical protein
MQYVKAHGNPRIARNLGEFAVQNSAELPGILRKKGEIKSLS